MAAATRPPWATSISLLLQTHSLKGEIERKGAIPTIRAGRIILGIPEHDDSSYRRTATEGSGRPDYHGIRADDETTNRRLGYQVGQEGKTLKDVARKLIGTSSYLASF